MNDQIELLSATEYSIIEEALWKLVRQYPRQIGDPDVKAEYDALGTNKSLAVFVVGGRKKKSNVLGGFTAEINFCVAYKSNPTTSTLRIDALDYVGRIVKWLENVKDLPRLTDNRTITKITAVGVPYKDDTSQDKSTVYVADAVMEYRKKEDDLLI